MASRNSSSGNGTFLCFILLLVVIGAAISFFQRYWPIIAAVGAVLLLILIVYSVKKSKARKAYLSQPVLYIGNASTKTFHLPSCRLVSDISQKNRIAFRSYEETAAGGYSPCGVCKPRPVRK